MAIPPGNTVLGEDQRRLRADQRLGRISNPGERVRLGGEDHSVLRAEIRWVTAGFDARIDRAVRLLQRDPIRLQGGELCAPSDCRHIETCMGKPSRQE